jgi:hypothetical protein
VDVDAEKRANARASTVSASLAMQRLVEALASKFDMNAALASEPIDEVEFERPTS